MKNLKIILLLLIIKYNLFTSSIYHPGKCSDEIDNLEVIKLAKEDSIILRGTTRYIEQKIKELEVELKDLKSLLNEQNQPPKPLALNLGENAMLKLGGFVQMRAFDTGLNINTPEEKNDLELRRARVQFNGNIGEKAFLQYSFDLGNNLISTRDAFFDYKIYPHLNFRIGQFKLPFTHELLLSGADVIFERSLPTLRLFPNARDRGFLLNTDIKGIANLPVSLFFGIVNGAGISQADNNFAKDIITGFNFTSKYVDVISALQYGKFNFDRLNGKPLIANKQRLTFSLHRNFGFGNSKLWDAYGGFALGHGDFPNGKYLLNGILGTDKDFSDEDVKGYNLVFTRKVSEKSPISIWLKYDNFDPNIHTSNNSIEIISYGTKLDINKNINLVGGIFHKNFKSQGKDISLKFQTQLRY